MDVSIITVIQIGLLTVEMLEILPQGCTGIINHDVCSVFGITCDATDGVRLEEDTTHIR